MQSRCKSCFVKYRCERKEKTKEYNKSYRAINLEKLKKSKAEYKLLNKEAIKEKIKSITIKTKKEEIVS